MRRRWVVLAVALGAALAVAAPVAWATFSDVPPSDPFYDDINAIQGAGITSGCGGGKFCPNSNITREAEAAFVHRGAPRTSYMENLGMPVDPVDTTDLGSVQLDIGGVAGGSQFVVLNAAVTTSIADTSGCPCQTAFEITDDTGAPLSITHYNLNDTVAADGIGYDSGEATVVVQVDTASTQVFHVVAYNDSGTGVVTAEAELSAITAPFGSSGTDSLDATRLSSGKR
jgi:hypothetical protein